MNNAVQIGKIVRQLREERGLTQKELANKIGWNQPSVCTLEKGRRKSVNTTDLNAIALALQSQPEEFLYGSENDKCVCEGNFGRVWNPDWLNLSGFDLPV